MHTATFAQATYYFIMNFNNLKKCDISKMRKKSILVKISSVWCFLMSTRPVYYQLHLNLILYFTKNHFSSKMLIFCIFNKKKRGLKDTFFERPLIFCP